MISSSSVCSHSIGWASDPARSAPRVSPDRCRLASRLASAITSVVESAESVAARPGLLGLPGPGLGFFDGGAAGLEGLALRVKRSDILFWGCYVGVTDTDVNNYRRGSGSS